MADLGNDPDGDLEGADYPPFPSDRPAAALLSAMTRAPDVPEPESVNHPRHYGSHPSGVECITIVEHMGFNVGNVVKYVWRADEKGDAIENLEKAAWYLNREIERRKKMQC